MYRTIRHLLPSLMLTAALVGCASTPPRGVPMQPAAQSDVLAQTSWELARWTRPGGPLRPVPHGGAATHEQPVTLSFTREQGQPHLSGYAGCNRYAGSYTVANGLLVVPAPPVATRMACPAARMQLEQDYLAGLSSITASRLDSDTQPQRLTLVLRSGDVLDFGRRADPAVGGTAGAAKLVYVAPRRVPCGCGDQCYQVRDTPAQPWQTWPGAILGFHFQPGIEYRLRVVEVREPDPSAGVRWVLDAVIEQRVVGG